MGGPGMSSVVLKKRDQSSHGLYGHEEPPSNWHNPSSRAVPCSIPVAGHALGREAGQRGLEGNLDGEQPLGQPSYNNLSLLWGHPTTSYFALREEFNQLHRTTLELAVSGRAVCSWRNLQQATRPRKCLCVR